MRRQVMLLSVAGLAVCAAAARGADTVGLSPDAGDYGDRFGHAIAADGGTMLVGAPGHDEDATDAGTAFVYVRRGIFLPLQTELRPSDPSEGAHFGASVGVLADVAVVGAPDDAGVGAVYVFERTDGGWNQTIKLNGQSWGDRFGASVAIDGDTIAVGAPGRGEGSGAVFVYVRNGAAWTQQADVEGLVAAGGFGTSVDLRGNRFVAGTPFDTSSSGFAAVFARSGSEWYLEATLVPPAVAEGDETGTAVAISDGRVVVGAPRADAESETDAGAVDVFDLIDGTWGWSTRLVSRTPLANAQFGSSVAVEDGRVAVGSPYRDGDQFAAGAVDLFRAGDFGWEFVKAIPVPAPGDWDEAGAAVAFANSRVALGVPGRGPGAVFVEAEGATRELTASDASVDDSSGWSVDISGDTAIVGAFGDDDHGTDSGAAYVFVRNGDLWVEQQKLTAADGEAYDSFGCSVAISGDTALVGAYRDDDLGADAGAAYVFVRSAGVWTAQGKLTAQDGAAGDWFGRQVALSGGTALVAAQRDDDNGTNSGSAYVYVRTGTAWSEQQKLTAPNGAANDSFGRAVAIEDDTVIVGASMSDDRGDDAGAAYVFVRADGVWTVQQELAASDAEAGDWFGSYVALDEDTAIVAAYGDDDRGNGAGAAYAFVRSGGSWTEQQKLTASDGRAAQAFGWDVAVSGDVAVIGAYGDDAVDTGAGAAYAFLRSNGTWTEQRRLTAEDGGAGDRFACEIAIDDGIAILGAFGHDEPVGNAGTAYVVDVTGRRPNVTAGTVPAEWTVGIPLSWTNSIEGGTPPYHWRTPDGSLPAGLAVNAKTGAVSGTPTTAGDCTFTIECVDAWGTTAQAAGALVVNAPLAVTTSSLAPWTVTRTFARTMAAVGGTAPLKWSVVGGTLPPSASLADDGSLAGLATQAGDYSFVVRVADAVGAEATRTVSMKIHHNPTVVTGAVPAWTETRPYRQTLVASGGTEPLTWQLVSGSLPVEGTLGASTGEIAGTSKAAGLYTFTVLVTDAAGAEAIRTISAQVRPWPQVTTASLPTAAAGRPFDAVLGVSGGTGPYRWTQAGLIPAGLAVDLTTGHLTGMAAVAGAADATVQVTDAAGASATRTIPLLCVPRADLATSQLVDTYEIAPGSADIVRYVEFLGDTEVDLKMTVKAATAAGVTLLLLDENEQPLDLAPYTKTRKSTTTVKDFPVPATGRYFLVLRPDAAFQGSVTLGVAAAATKTWKGRGTITAGGPPLTIDFHALPGSTLVVKTKATKRSSALPTVTALVDEAEQNLLVYGDVRRSRSGETFTTGPALAGGDYWLAFAPRGDEGGEIEWTITLKSPKGYAFDLRGLAVRDR